MLCPEVIIVVGRETPLSEPAFVPRRRDAGPPLKGRARLAGLAARSTAGPRRVTVPLQLGVLAGLVEHCTLPHAVSGLRTCSHQRSDHRDQAQDRTGCGNRTL